MNQKVKKRLYTTEEAAELLGLSSCAVRHLQHRGHLPFIKIGKRVSFDVKDIERFIQQHKQRIDY